MNITDRKILLVDDDEDILNLIESILKKFGFSNIVKALNQREALKILSELNIEMAILDIILPDGSGFEIIEKIRKYSNIPVLFLSAISDIEKQYDGFYLGADDYIVKPFKEKELILRTRAILTRAYPESKTVKLIGSTIDFDNASVSKDGEEILLTAKEYNILYLLYQNKNRIVTIDGILSAVWGDDYFGYENTLMAHISKIRQKIEINPSKPKNLITYKSLGYKLRV